MDEDEGGLRATKSGQVKKRKPKTKAPRVPLESLTLEQRYDEITRGIRTGSRKLRELEMSVAAAEDLARDHGCTSLELRIGSRGLVEEHSRKAQGWTSMGMALDSVVFVKQL